jgi:hypothetical protein
MMKCRRGKTRLFVRSEIQQAEGSNQNSRNILLAPLASRPQSGAQLLFVVWNLDRAPANELPHQRVSRNYVVTSDLL